MDDEQMPPDDGGREDEPDSAGLPPVSVTGSLSLPRMGVRVGE